MFPVWKNQSTKTITLLQYSIQIYFQNTINDFLFSWHWNWTQSKTKRYEKDDGKHMIYLMQPYHKCRCIRRGYTMIIIGFGTIDYGNCHCFVNLSSVLEKFISYSRLSAFFQQVPCDSIDRYETHHSKGIPKMHMSVKSISKSIAYSPGKSHENTANLDKSMLVAMVVAMETPVNFGYGPHLIYPALPWKCNPVSMVTQGISDADHIQNQPGSPWQQPWQPEFFYPDLQFSHENLLKFHGLIASAYSWLIKSFTVRKGAT